MKNITILLALLLGNALFAQNVEQSKLKVIFGPTFSLGKSEVNTAILGTPSEGLIYITEDNSNLNIKKLSTANAITSTETIKIKDLGAGASTEKIVVIGSKAFSFYYNHDKSERFLVSAIDSKTGKREEGQVLVDKPNLAWYPTDDGIMYEKAFSIDSSKILIAYRYPGKSSDDKVNYDEIGVQVYDANFKLLWSSDFKLPYTEVVMDNKNFGVDSEGNAYLLAKVFDNTTRYEKQKDGSPYSHYELLRMSQNSKTIRKTPIKLGKFINSSKLLESPKGGMLVVGFYSDYPKITTSNGAFVVRTDTEGNLLSGKNMYEFPATVLRLNTSITDKDVNFISLRQVIVEKDGSILIAGEGFDQVSNGNTSLKYYGDILLMKIGEDNDMHWCKGIRKLQIGSAYTQNFGLGVLPHNGGYYVFYTDHAVNFGKSQNETPEKLGGIGGWLVYNKINADGTMQNKKKLFEYEKNIARVTPDKIVLREGNKAVMKGYWGNNQRVITIELE